jgi:hypothetical protein
VPARSPESGFVVTQDGIFTEFKPGERVPFLPWPAVVKIAIEGGGLCALRVNRRVYCLGGFYGQWKNKDMLPKPLVLPAVITMGSGPHGVTLVTEDGGAWVVPATAFETLEPPIVLPVPGLTDIVEFDGELALRRDGTVLTSKEPSGPWVVVGM